MILIYEGANLHTLSAGARHRVRLVPGQNEVPDDVWAEVLEKSTGVKHLIETGKLREFRAQREDGTAVAPRRSDEVNVAELKVISVKEIVENTTDVPKLRGFLAQENRREGGARKSVLDLIGHRIELLTTPPKAEGEGAGEGGSEAGEGSEAKGDEGKGKGGFMGLFRSSPGSQAEPDKT